MKRILMGLLLGLTIVPLAACGDDTPGTGGGTTNPEGTPDWASQPITLNYSVVSKVEDSTVPAIEELMLEAFTEKYPNITVNPIQLDWSISETWGDKIIEFTTTGTIIDVFLVPRLEDLAGTGYLADLTDFYDNDEDTAFIMDNVSNLGVFDEVRYTVPTFLYPSFWVVNEDVLSEAGVETPNSDWTWAQMEGIAKTFANINNVHGLYDTSPYLYEYPKHVKTQEDAAVGKTWFARSYDGTKFNYSDSATQKAMSDLYTGMEEGWISANEMLPAAEDPRYLGQAAMWRQPAWEFKDYVLDMPFNFKILPAPSHAGMGNTDCIAVHSMSQNKEAAYNLLKWMTYDEEGILKRFEIYNDNIDVIGLVGNNFPIPIVNYGADPFTGENKIWDNIPYANLGEQFEYLSSPDFLLSVENAAIQANKDVVGWNASDLAISSYFAQIEAYEATYADVMEAIQRDSDAALRLAIETLRNSLK